MVVGRSFRRGLWNFWRGGFGGAVLGGLSHT